MDAAVGLRVTLWTVDTRDWESHNPGIILNEVKQQTNDGGIILMHDIHATTIESLDRVLSYLQSEGYQFVSVSHLGE